MKYTSYFIIMLLVFIINETVTFKLLDEIDDNNDKKDKVPILLRNYKREYKVKATEQVRLKCPIDLILSQNVQYNTNDDYDYNNNLIIINWFDNANNKIIPSFLNSKRVSIENDIYLVIKNINSNDAGIYRCEANNGFGTVSVNLTLTIFTADKSIKEESTTAVVMKTTTTVSSSSSTTTPIKPIAGAPLFSDKVLNEKKLIHKLKSDELKLKCNIRKPTTKTDILWYKDNTILNEEDFGITRSKWVLSLKDLRLEDTGNYTCQVFNKYGFINATYELYVHDESQLFESIDPVNSTVEIGQDATFACKVNNDLVTKIQWLKQISREEYDDYVSDRDLAQLQDHNKDSNKLNSFLNSFFIQANYEKVGTNGKIEKRPFEYIDGTHYITIKDEKQNQEKLIVNAYKKNIYINTLTIKNTTKKDSGVYICFGITSNGYNYRKAYLSVKQSNDVAGDETGSFIFVSGYNIKLQNLLIIIVPLAIISIFSIISIIYLRCMQRLLKRENDHKKFTKLQLCRKFIVKFLKLNHEKGDEVNNVKTSKNFYLPVVQADSMSPPPLPTSKPPSSTNLERHLNEYFQNDDSQTKLILSTSNNTSSLSSTSTYLMPLTKNPSTTTTTISTTTGDSVIEPSIVYYKVLDFNTLNELNRGKNMKKKKYSNKRQQQQQAQKRKADSDAKTIVSTATTNSRFYYQLNSDIDGK